MQLPPFTPVALWGVLTFGLALAAQQTSCFATEKSGFECVEAFRPFVCTNEVLMLAGVDLITLSDGKTYMVALGTTKTPAQTEVGAQSRLNTRKVAEAKSRKAATEFLSVEVQSETKLVELRETEKATDNSGVKTQISKLLKRREEIITQRSKAVLGGSKTVATWLSQDGLFFNVVVAIEVQGLVQPCK